jgi:N-acetylneuraminic acid mutarotase
LKLNPLSASLGNIRFYNSPKAFIMKKKLKEQSSVQKWLTLVFLFFLVFIFSYPSYGQDWVDSNLSEAKIWIGGTSHGSKIYLGGGQLCNNVATAKVEIYDARTDQWDASHSLSAARGAPAVVACGDKILFAGGMKYNAAGATFYSIVEIFDPSNNGWSQAGLSVPRLTTGVSNGSKAIFAGGLIDYEAGASSIFETTNVVDIYDSVTNSWTTDTLSEARDAFNAVVVGDLAIIAGGFNGQKVTNKVDIYHFSTGQWTTDTLSVPRGNMSSTVVGTKAYFAGGVTQNSLNSNVIDIYDSETGNWTVEQLPAGRAFLGSINAATLKGKAYFVNGGNLNLFTSQWTGNGYNRVDIYDPSASPGSRWSLDVINCHFVNHTVVALETDTISKLLVAGGSNCWNCGASVDIFSKIETVFFDDQKVVYNIFPNPASGYLNVSVDFQHKTDGVLTLFDVKGKTLIQQKFNVTTIDRQIDVSAYPQGVYMLEVRTDTGRIVEKVMVLE